MPIAEIRVSILGDLIDKVTPTEPDPKTGRRRDSGVYRGDGDARWPLLTSLDKLGGVGSPHSKVELEEHILRNFIRYSRPYFSTPTVNDWEVLVAAQHHGLGSALTKFIIPAGEAARFRDQLDLVSVDERRLFPDLDGVAAEMRRYYS